MLPRVSVIVPAYNSGKTIAECLEALASQTYPAGLYETIVVDDGSTDSTPSLVGKFPVKYLRQKNSGPATARNRGAREASGEIILFTDSDCVADPDWIEEMTGPFKDPEVVAVKGAYRTNQRSIVARFAQLEFEERFEMLKKAESIDMVDTYSAGYRRDLFMAAGGFDASFPVANNEDTELSYRLSVLGHKMVFNPGARVCHLRHPDSVKRYASLKFWRGYWRMAVYKRFPGKMLKDHYTPQSLKLGILFVFLFAAGAAFAALVPRPGVYVPMLAALCFALTCVPFTLSALRKDPAVALFSPFLLLVRASAIGAGALWGAVGGMRPGLG